MLRPALWFVILFACLNSLAAAQEANVKPSEVEAEISNSIGETSWYDSETGQLRPVTVRERVEDSGNRNSRWLPKPKKLRKPNAPGGGLGGGGGNFGLSTMGNVFGWTMMALCALLLVGLLIYFFSKGEMEVELGQRGARKRGTGMPDEDLAERMEQLPVEVRQQGSDLRGEAERCMRAGDFDRAIICLFGHQLLQLDRHQVLRLARGKTNRQYVRESHAHGDAGHILQQTVDSFEASYFGRHAVADKRFEFLWQENERLEKLLFQQREAAA